MSTFAPVSVMLLQSAAELARDQAAVAREQASIAREQAQAMRIAAQEARTAARAPGVTVVYPGGMRPISRRQEGMFFVVFLVCIIAAASVLRPIFRAIGRRIEQAPRRDELAPNGSAERLERIEQAVEAMAIEIERISEGQRFTTRLLSSRMPSELLPPQN